MTNEPQAGQKGLSKGQAGLLIAAGIVLTLGGCGMPMSQRFVGVGMLLVGAGLFGSGFVLLLRANAQTQQVRANETPKEVTEPPAWKPALVILVGGAALAIAGISRFNSESPVVITVARIAFVAGTVVGLIGLGKLLKRLERSITRK